MNSQLVKLLTSIILLSNTFYSLQAQQKKTGLGLESDSISIRKMDELNTSFVETNAYVTVDRTKLFFMSTRGGSQWNTPNYTRVNGNAQGDGDLFYSERTNTNASWGKAKNMGSICNSSESEDEPISNLDGELYVFESWRRTWRRTGGPYYKYYPDKGLRSLHKGITAFFIRTNLLATDGATLSPDGQLFIFAAGQDLDRNMDLYYIHLSNPKATVKKLNLSTEKNERTPFLAADGKTIYFASNGYGGLGGLDVFKATWNGNKFDSIVPLGAPVNSNQNDYNFTIDGKGNWAYMVKDDDLYEIDFSNAPKRFKPDPVSTKTIVITDCETKKVLQSKQVIQMYNGMNGTMHRIKTQHYITSDNKEEEMVFTRKNYEALILPGSNSQVQMELDSVCLKPAKETHVYFDHDKYVIKNREVLMEFNEIKKHRVEDQRILLIGMSSSIGNPEYNMKLAEKRTLEVKRQLIQRGIPSKWIKIVVLGEQYSDQLNAKASDRQVIVKYLTEKKGDNSQITE